MKTALIVQARNGSSRYPRKMCHDFHGRTALEWVLRRSGAVGCAYKILATTREAEDDILAEAAGKLEWEVVRGEVRDVLGRFADAVRIYKPDVVVRLTGDCILTDPRLVEYALDAFSESGVGYLWLTQIIDGFDVEVLSARALLEADKCAKPPSEREHVTPWLKKNGCFKKVGIPYGKADLSRIHLSLDYRADAEVIDRILGRLNRSDFSYDDVVELIKNDPALIQNATTARVGDGNARSAEADRRWIRSRLAPPLKLDASAKRHFKVLEIIPGGAQTFSKSALQFSKGASPLYVKAGKGAVLCDLDDNRYVDYTMGLGACILGYAFEPVLKAVRSQLAKGSSYTLPHHLEYDLSVLLTELIPSAEMVRFGKNGSDVTSAAVRVARAYTGRDKIACCGYHGWQDWYIATTSRNKGIPMDVRRLTLSFGYNKIKSLERLFEVHPGEIACVIMEPVSLEAPAGSFLGQVQEIAHRNGALLIFDEVVTGFRFSLGGAQAFFNVVPDLSCFGKGMGNGLPIAALVGKKEIMQLFDEVFFSTTFGGETASIAAALATIHYMQDKNIIKRLWRFGKDLMRGISALIEAKGLKEQISLTGYPVRSFLNIREDEGLKIKALIQQECARRGLLFTGAHNMSLSHNKAVIEKTLSIYDAVFDIIRYALEYQMIDDLLEGEALTPVFRKV